MIKKCVICQEEYENRDKRSRCCSNKECHKTLGKQRYKKKINEKICINCKETFIGTQNRTHCNLCKRKNVKLEKIEITVLCRNCKKPTGKVEKNITHISPTGTLEGNICEDCKSKSSDLRSKSKIGDKNPNWKGGPNLTKVPMTKEELSHLQSIRMTGDKNPMKNPETVKKMSETIKRGYVTGTIKKRFGKDNPRWKGGGRAGGIVRYRLAGWNIEILKRDDYTCQLCSIRGGRLEVHHIEPLRDIIKNFLQKLNIWKSIKDIDIESKEFELICHRIRNYHFDNLQIGITYCASCHGKIDKHRHYKEGVCYENKKNIKKKT